MLLSLSHMCLESWKGGIQGGKVGRLTKVHDDPVIDHRQSSFLGIGEGLCMIAIVFSDRVGNAPSSYSDPHKSLTVKVGGQKATDSGGCLELGKRV